MCTCFVVNRDGPIPVSVSVSVSVSILLPVTIGSIDIGNPVWQIPDYRLAC